MKDGWVLNISKNSVIPRWTVGRILAKESKHSCEERLDILNKKKER